MQSTTPTPSEQILSIVLGFWKARALAVATELGLPDLVTERALHVEELANRTKTNPSALFRLLRALESVGIFTEVSPRVFANTATSESLRKETTDSQWALLRFVLHDWTDAQAARILASVRRVMKPAGRLIVIESVIAEGPSFSFGKWSDLQMLVCVEGRERTETEYRALLARASFDLQEVVATQSPLSLLVAKPA
jgi:hypothetical protein